MNLRKFVPVLAGAGVAAALTLAGTGIAAAASSGAPQPPGTHAKTGTAVSAASLCQNLWAVVNADGSLARAGCPGTTSDMLGGGGFEVIFPSNVRNCAYNASVGDSGSAIVPPSGEASVVGRAGNVDGVFVQTYNSAGTATPQAFHLAVHCAPPARSGKVKILAGNTAATVTVPGGLSSSSIALATPQTNQGVYVAAATPNTTTGKITIRLNKAAPHAVTVGWSVVN